MQISASSKIVRLLFKKVYEYRLLFVPETTFVELMIRLKAILYNGERKTLRCVVIIDHAIRVTVKRKSLLDDEKKAPKKSGLRIKLNVKGFNAVAPVTTKTPEPFM